MSLRFRASKQGIENVPMPSNRNLKGHGPIAANRAAMRAKVRQKITNIRETQQAEMGFADLPYELIDASGSVLKKTFMNGYEARARNHSVASLGFIWRRSGY